MIQAIDQTEDLPSTPPADDPANGDFIAIMMRRKWVIILFTALGCGLGYLMFVKTPPLFKSSAQVLIIVKNPMLPIQSRIAMSGFTQMVTDDVLATEAVVISSPKIIGAAVQKGQIQKYRSMANVSQEAVVGTIMGGMSIVRGGDGGTNGDAHVLTVSYTGPDPLDCQEVVRTVLESYQDFLRESRRQYSEEVITLIERARVTLQDKLQTQNREYDSWRQKVPVPLLFNEDKSNVHSDRMTEIESKRSAARMRLTSIEATIKIIQEAQEAGASLPSLEMLLRNIANVAPAQKSINGSNELIQTQLLPLFIQEQVLTQKFGPEHPQVRAVRLQVEALQGLLLNHDETNGMTSNQFLNVALESLQQEKKVQFEIEQALGKEWEKEREAARVALNFLDRDRALRDEIDRIKKLSDQVVGRLDEMGVQDPGGMEVQLLSSPGPGYQVQPILQRSLAIGGVLGMILGMGLAYLIDLADKSFRTPDEIRGQLRLPVIGHIPVIDPPSRRERKKRASGEPSKVGEMVVCHHRPRSTVAEAYRQIRTALYFGTGGEEHKVIQITSSDAGDGKTTLAINLAVSIAQSGKRVCLVDADFRRSRVHEEFGLDRMHGISSVMAGKEELSDAIQESGIENLSILASGPRASNPAELLTSHHFKELLDVLRSKFDTIILDTPPLLAVTDPCAVAPRVDSVVLVLRITKNAKPNAMRAKQVLDGLGAKVIGIVVNGVDINNGYGHDSGYRRYTSAGRYGGGYGYGDYTYGSYYSEDPSDATEVHIPSLGVNNVESPVNKDADV